MRKVTFSVSLAVSREMLEFGVSSQFDQSSIRKTAGTIRGLSEEKARMFVGASVELGDGSLQNMHCCAYCAVQLYLGC